MPRLGRGSSVRGSGRDHFFERAPDRRTNALVDRTRATPRSTCATTPAPLVTVLTLLGFAAPVVGYFLLVRGYSLNVVTGDQWDDVVVIGRSHAHLFDWSSLWAQHNENRIFFPNLIVLLLAHTTAFNVQVEEYLSFVLLLASTGLIIGALQTRVPRHSLALPLPRGDSDAVRGPVRECAVGIPDGLVSRSSLSGAEPLPSRPHGFFCSAIHHRDSQRHRRKLLVAAGTTDLAGRTPGPLPLPETRSAHRSSGSWPPRSRPASISTTGIRPLERPNTTMRGNIPSSPSSSSCS